MSDAGSMRFASISRAIRFGTPLPRGADVEAPAGQLRQARQGRRVEQALRRIAAIEQPDRFVEQAAERDQRRVVVAVVAATRLLAGAALHEREVDAGVRVVEQLQVLGRALRARATRPAMPYSFSACT